MSTRIPQNEWGAIVARREQGESVASIAKSYDCSPPLIYSILNRVKIDASEAAMQDNGANTGARAEEQAAPPVAELPLAAPRPVRQAPEPRASAEPQAERPVQAQPQNAQANNQGNGAPRLTLPFREGGRDGGNNGGPRLAAVGGEQRQPAPQPQSYQPREQHQPQHQQPRPQPSYQQDGNGNGGGRVEAMPLPRVEKEKPIALTASLDAELQKDVESVIAAFRTAFDKALADRSPEARDTLLKASSELMRAGARTTIVLERLASGANRQGGRRDFGGQQRDRA